MARWCITALFCIPAILAQETCECENVEHLLLNYNPKTKIHVSPNETADTVAALDYLHNISALYNGRTGAALAFNYETGISYYIPPGSEITWMSNQTSFDDYFKNLPPQVNLYQYGEANGVRFDPSSITEEISNVMVDILAPLSEEYNNRCEALAIYLQISKITADYLETSLVGFQDVMGKFTAPLRGDFKWLVGIYQGIGALFEAIPGGMPTLLHKKVTLDMNTILTLDSGIHVLIYFMEELSKHFDVGKILGKALNDPLEFFSLIDKLGGEMGYAFDGYVHAINEIVKFTYNQSSIPTIENVLQEYGNSPLTNSKDINEKHIGKINDLIQVIEKLHLNWSLKYLKRMLEDIIEGTWTLNNVNMSAILQVLIRIDPSNDENLIPQVIKLL